MTNNKNTGIENEEKNIPEEELLQILALMAEYLLQSRGDSNGGTRQSGTDDSGEGKAVTR